MISDKEIDDVINMIDGRMRDGVSRLKLDFDDNKTEGEIREQYHHGRCDIGSPWDKGTPFACNEVDRR